MGKWIMVVLFGLTSFTAQAGELVLLPIKNIQQRRSDDGIRLIVTIDFQACKYSYKGLLVEPAAEHGQGQVRLLVRALASERLPGSCADAIEPRTDSVLIPAATSDRYEFSAVQPQAANIKVRAAQPG